MATNTKTTEPAIRLNNQTAENLIDYLRAFPPDAKVTIWRDYNEYDCVICCNTEHQQKTKTAQLMLGAFVQSS